MTGMPKLQMDRANTALLRAATYAVAQEVIWSPDDYEASQVGEAAVLVLSTPRAPSADAHQASYLVALMRQRMF